MRIIDNGLVPVYEGEGNNQVVNARDLHAFLESGRDFSNWIQDRVAKYEFQEGVDFSTELLKTPAGGRPRTEYLLTIDCAKEIAMVENNEKGRQVRKYLIEIERRFRQMVVAPPSQAQMALMMAQALVEQEKRLAVVESRVEAIESRQREAEAELVALPAPTGAVADITPRALLNRLVRSYSMEQNLSHQVLWNRLYTEFRDRYHVDLKARSTKNVSPLDVAERLGHVQTLYNLAVHLFASRAS